MFRNPMNENASVDSVLHPDMELIMKEARHWGPVSLEIGTQL